MTNKFRRRASRYLSGAMAACGGQGIRPPVRPNMMILPGGDVPVGELSLDVVGVCQRVVVLKTVSRDLESAGFPVQVVIPMSLQQQASLSRQDHPRDPARALDGEMARVIARVPPVQRHLAD